MNEFDPPYRKTLPPFIDTDREDLAKLLAGIQGKFILTYNDHPRTRKSYKDSKIAEVVTPPPEHG